MFKITITDQLEYEKLKCFNLYATSKKNGPYYNLETDKFELTASLLPVVDIVYKGKEEENEETEAEQLIESTSDNEYIKQFTFSGALEYLKNGFNMYRKGWNGKNLYVKLYTPVETAPVNEPFFIIRNGDRTNTWVPSVSDIMADDWMIVNAWKE